MLENLESTCHAVHISEFIAGLGNSGVTTRPSGRVSNAITGIFNSTINNE